MQNLDGIKLKISICILMITIFNLQSINQKIIYSNHFTKIVENFVVCTA